jgi:hypothetical protein
MQSFWIQKSCPFFLCFWILPNWRLVSCSGHKHVLTRCSQCWYGQRPRPVMGEFKVGILGSWRRDSSVGIATRYGLEGPGIESRWGDIFRTYPDRLRCPPSLLYNGYRVFPEGTGGQSMMPRLRKGWAIPPLSLWVLLGLLRGSLFYIGQLAGWIRLVDEEPNECVNSKTMNRAIVSLKPS